MSADVGHQICHLRARRWVNCDAAKVLLQIDCFSNDEHLSLPKLQQCLHLPFSSNPKHFLLKEPPGDQQAMRGKVAL